VPSILQTDGYKFSMAQAGFPTRRETFYLSFRRGGWQYVPFDLETEVRGMLPDGEALAEIPGIRGYLDGVGYGMSSAMAAALRAADVVIRAVPAGTWVYEREPIITITGPSFLVSWLEPQILRLFFPLQLATEVHRGNPRDIDKNMLFCTCDEQADIARRVLAAAGDHTHEVLSQHMPRSHGTISSAYARSVTERARALVEIVGDPARIFEVGMRSATCEAQHEICLAALREAGIRSTSNVALARKLDMFPVGTMGHEHVQRWNSDRDAYRAMRDTRQGRPSYLLDTFDTITSGIPAAIQVMREQAHEAAIRYDSGDKFGQYIYAHGEFQRHGLEPTHVIEDSLDADMTAKFERLRAHTELPPEKQVYGYGGYLVHGDWPNPLTRDRVSAVYKLSETSGEPRMKFGNEAGLGKVSVPGRPVVWRRLRGSGPLSIIGQAEEPVPEDYVALNGNPDALDRLRVCNIVSVVRDTPKCPYVLSPETQRMVASLGGPR